ncbi:MAG TPA: DNA polymerase domain-containing protein [Spirochaetia bacterium]|nr:DNA polymerase domain-containing protein [Spirochaetia bacterium]
MMDGRRGPWLRGVAAHVYADYRRDRVFVVGRLDDGRSFAAEDSSWRPAVYLSATDAASAQPRFGGYRFETCGLEAIDGRELVAWTAPGFGAYRDAVAALERAGATVHGSGSIADLYRADLGLALGVRVSGDERPGRRVGLVLADAAVEAAPDASAPLSVLSLDIETDESDRSVRAASLAMADWSPSEGRLVPREGSTIVIVVAAPGAAGLAAGPAQGYEAIGRPDEASLIRSLSERVLALDPDVLTGWNVVDFDLARLVERAEANGMALDIGRSSDGARVLPKGRGRTATAVVPGRQVIDAMRVARSGPERYEDYSLETVARRALGQGKGSALRGRAKLDWLDRVYRDDPAAFADYAALDAELVPQVLGRTGLFALTVARAALVGVGLERAWTSVAAFERAYGQALRERSVAPPPFEAGRRVSGAAGGTVLPAEAGYRDGVVVLDFKSLYPSVMRTFCVDPLAYERSGRPDDVVAPNGARFAREPPGERWPLPALVDAYMARRELAMADGDATGSYVYKILMNSFYGVLGTDSCRYARTELAGAITSFGRLVLLRAKARIEREGRAVIYGDTDSLFVNTGLGPDASHDDYRREGDRLCRLVNEELSSMAEREYGLASRLELRFDKAYARFVIPPLRVAETAEDDGVSSRGRGKGYAGLLRGRDGDRVDVKGMEAVRSDWTPLAREFQLRLLELAFSGSGEAATGDYIASTLAALGRGELDARLVYTRILRRAASAYVKSTPPQVKAARLAGITGRGAVSYVITADGPAPVDPEAYGSSGPGDPRPDYRHYESKQLLPIARSLAASGLSVSLDAFGEGGHGGGQRELAF